MHTTTLRKVGGSVMLSVPRPLLEVLQLEAGVEVGVTIEDGRLVVQPRERPGYALDELLAQCEPEAERTDEERAWLEAPRAGDELL
jgi:antitoxin ChpS